MQLRYPEGYEKGNAIVGLGEVQDSLVFHAGTKLVNGEVVTNGGRVLAVSSFGDQMEKALQNSYANVAKIQFKDMNYRRDIGRDLVDLYSR